MSHYWHRTRVAEGLIALLTILFLLFLFGPKLVAPPPVDANHPFDTAATFERMARILGNEAPHPVDSEASDDVINRLLLEIRGLGFTPRVDDAFHCSHYWRINCARIRNIGFWVTEPGDDAIMIASHHDSVPTGPGAADDMMGVASSLEIARLMQGRDLPRPLYVLITDAEEIGLVGASHFVQNSPVAQQIGAVVSLEARGNRGITSMFETSDPNGRDLAALVRPHAHAVKGPTSNSLAVDIYRAMPNGTDVTEYLKLDIDAANYAMVGHPSHYHTPDDNLENLSRDAVFHIGTSALRAVEGLMQVSSRTSDQPKIYADILGITTLVVPAFLGLPLIGLGLGLCGIALFRTDRKQAPLWRVLLFPLAVLALGTGSAMLTSMAISMLRPEPAFGTAYPIALRGLLVCIALLGGTLMARWLYRPVGADRFLAGSWVAILSFGLIASLLFPGAKVLFALPALLVIPGAILLILRAKRTARILFALASLLTLALILPTHALAETALFVESSAPLMALVLWVFVTSLPLFWREQGSTRRPIMGALIMTAVFAVATLSVPAYTQESPLGLNLLHLQSDRMEGPALTIGARQGVPEAMRAVAEFEQSDLPGFGGPYWHTRSTRMDLPPVSLNVLEDRVVPDGRAIRFQLLSPTADEVGLFIDGEAPTLSELIINEQVIALKADSAFPSLRCVGRQCQAMTVSVTFADPGVTPTFALSATQYGISTELGRQLLDARPDWAGPQHNGDRTVRRRYVTLDAR